jgi:hypothetical protein
MKEQWSLEPALDGPAALEQAGRDVKRLRLDQPPCPSAAATNA